MLVNPRIASDLFRPLIRRNFMSLINMQTVAEKTIGGGDHLTITADSFRRNSISSATVNRVQDLSPTVKKLTLDAHQPKDVAFKAGQWVDFFIPSVTTVGGFSMCSAPHLLNDEGKLELAIKYSSHPPANWVHTRCQPGAVVGIKVGGNFAFDPAQFSSSSPTSSSSSSSSSLPHSAPATPDDRSVLLIAGGVGINPLVSIMDELSFHVKKNDDRRSIVVAKCLLLFSAAREEELLFKNEIDAMVESTRGFDVRYFITRPAGDEGSSSSSTSTSLSSSSTSTSSSSTSTSTSTLPSATTSSSNFIRRRIDFDYLRSHVFGTPLSSSGLAAERCSTYVCGPPAMIDDVVDAMERIGGGGGNVFYEKWW